MAEERLTVTYRGPALQSGRMDVRELAPALIGVADAIAATSRVAFPNAPTPRVQVSATREGSFEVILHVVEAGLIDKVADLLAGRDATAVVNLSELIGICIGGYGLVRWLKGRKIRARGRPDNGRIKVIFNDGTEIDLPEQSLTVARDVDFRRAAKKTVDPVGDGVDSVEIRTDRDGVRIDRSDVPAFEVPDIEEEELEPVESVRNLRLLNVAFASGKWKVTEGDDPYWVKIADQQFLHRVETNQESFTAGDVLRVRMQTKQWNTATGIRAEHIVVRVIEHTPGPRQIPLPIEDTGDEEQADSA